METHNVLTDRLSELQAQLDKVNRKLAKKGLSPLVLTLGATSTTHVQDDPDGFTSRALHWTEVSIQGEAPKANGWTVLAQLIVTESGTAIHQFAGVEISDTWRTDAGRCEHCGLNRNRKKGDGGELEYCAESMLARAFAAVRLHGFAKSNRTDSTIGRVLAERSGLKVTEADLSAAKARIAELALVVPEDAPNNYVSTLGTIARCGWLLPQSAALWVSAACPGLSYTTRPPRFVPPSDDATSGRGDVWIGSPGERLAFGAVKVLAVVGLEPGEYGPRTLVVLSRVSDGARIVWFTGTVSDAVERGATLDLARATVKKLDTYKGQRQTVITRATLDPLAADRAA